MPVLSTVCDAIGESTASVVTAPFDWLAQAIGNTAATLFEAVWTVFDQTTLVDVTSPGYVAVYNILFGIAVFFMLGFFLLQLITGLIRRDPTALSRADLGLAKSVLGSFLVITLTATLLEIVDQLCIGLIHATGNTIGGMGVKIGLPLAGLTGLTLASPGVGAILIIFFGSLAITAAAIVWFSLLIRKALLLVAIVLAPIALSGASWDVTRGWFGKWAGFVIALIVSKLVITVVFLVAITQVDAPIDFDLAELTDLIAGIVLMAVAGFAPYMTYKFVSFLGFDLYHAMSSEQEAKQALNRPLPVPARPKTNDSKNVLDGNEDSSTDKPAAQSTPAPTSTPPPSTPPDGGDPAPTSTPPTGTPADDAPPPGGPIGTPAPEPTGGGGSLAGGTETAASGQTATTGATAAGPAAAVLIAAEIAKETAEAGPATGTAIAAAADGQLGSAQDTSTPPPADAPASIPTRTADAPSPPATSPPPATPPSRPATPTTSPDE